MNIIKDSNVVYIECNVGENKTYFPKDKFYKKVKFLCPFESFSSKTLYSNNNNMLYNGNFKITICTKNKGFIMKDFFNNSFVADSALLHTNGNYIKVNDFLNVEDCYVERENSTNFCVIPFFVVWSDSLDDSITTESCVSEFEIKKNVTLQYQYLQKFMLSELYENINTIKDKTIKNFIIEVSQISTFYRYDVFVFKIRNGGYFEVPFYLLMGTNSGENLLFFNSKIDFDNSYIISNDFSKINKIYIVWN